MNEDGTVRVRTTVVVNPGVSLYIDRDHGHFGAWIGKRWVGTDGDGNLRTTILRVPA